MPIPGAMTKRCTDATRSKRLFRRLQGFRRIVSRFDKLGVMFTAFIYYALIVEALRPEMAF